MIAPTVCDHCGKKYGWHLWHCPNLEEYLRINLFAGFAFLTNPRDPAAVRPLAPEEVWKIEEVE